MKLIHDMHSAICSADGSSQCMEYISSFPPSFGVSIHLQLRASRGRCTRPGHGVKQFIVTFFVPYSNKKDYLIQVCLILIREKLSLPHRDHIGRFNNYLQHEVAVVYTSPYLHGCLAGMLSTLNFSLRVHCRVNVLETQ